MRIYQITTRDVLRRRKRVLYIALGVAIGVAAVISVLTITAAGEQRIYSELDKYGPNLMVSPAINNVDMRFGDLRLGNLAVGNNYISEDSMPDVRRIADGAIKKALKINDDSDIAVISPKLYMNSSVKDTSVMVVGFQPEEEMVIKSWWSISAGRYPDKPDEALLGSQVSAILDAGLSEIIPIEDHNVTVVGILTETGSDDDYQIFIPLETAQAAFGKEGVISSMDIRALCSACPVEFIADSINNTIPGIRAIAVKQIAENEMNLMGKVNRFMLALAGIALVIGIFGVVNTMMASVHERIKDIGIMKAVGASGGQIVRMFLYESIVIGVAGGALGYLAGTFLSFLIGPLIFDGLDIAYAPQYILPALGIAIAVSTFASIYPAYRASRIKVADSLRSL